LKNLDLTDGRIISAALGLVVDGFWGTVTPSTLAKSLGVSEPELLSHAQIGDRPLLWAAQRVRDDLESVVERVVEIDDPHDAVRQLFGALNQRLTQYPGLVLLLFPPSLPQEKQSRAAVRLLGSMLRGLTLALCRQLGEGERLGSGWQPESASSLLLGLIVSANAESAAGDQQDAFEIWWSTVAGDAKRPAAETAVETTAAPSRCAEAISELDLAPLLKEGTDPLQTVLDALSNLQVAGVLKLKVPFRPNPLLKLLVKNGHGVVVFEETPGIWQVEIVNGGTPDVMDLRELESPEPLQRVLEEASALDGDEIFLARLPRFPSLLIPHLQQRGLDHVIHQEADGSVFIRVWRSS
jgi:hypothetical protein